MVFDMDALVGKILTMFGSFKKEALDLHALFEAGGNDERLVKDGLLEERGNEFYALTGEGQSPT